MKSLTLRQSWDIQRRVIWALLMREILTRFGRHNIGFLWLFVEPMIFTLGVTALWTAADLHHSSTLPIVAFAVTGYSAVLLWRNMPTRCIGAVEPNRALLFHRNVRVIDIFLARLLLEGAGATISLIVLTILFVSIGMMDPPEDVLKVIAGWLMIAWFGMALALLFGALSEKFEVVEKLWHPTSYLLFPLSGAAFMVHALPVEARNVILWLPMVHGTEYVREGFFGSKVVAIYDLTYMAEFNAVLTLLGLAAVRIASAEVIPE